MIRSLIFVPAKEKMLSKINTFAADAVIIDLEDSIEINDKKDALIRVKNYLNANTLKQVVFVRLNSDNFLEEATILSKFKDIGFMLPKFENTNYYSLCENIWKAHKVIALIETPKGLININSIASCDWVYAVGFGAEDYTCSTNMKNSIETLAFHKNYLITFCKAYNKLSFDTPSFCLDNYADFKKEVDNAVSIGFNGKMLIHPKHIDYINNAFINNDIEYIKNIVEQYEKNDSAISVIDGKIYEKMHINHFKKLIKENSNYESNR